MTDVNLNVANVTRAQGVGQAEPLKKKNPSGSIKEESIFNRNYPAMKSTPKDSPTLSDFLTEKLKQDPEKKSLSSELEKRNLAQEVFEGTKEICKKIVNVATDIIK